MSVIQHSATDLRWLGYWLRSWEGCHGIWESMNNHYQRKRICILVKAYPQSSKQYEETVCCAGITEDEQLLRLYPIPYRRLGKAQQFNRFDWVEMEIAPSDKDHRPESHKVFPDTINIVHRAKNVSEVEKVRL